MALISNLSRLVGGIQRQVDVSAQLASYLKHDGTVAMSGNLNLSSHAITSALQVSGISGSSLQITAASGQYVDLTNGVNGHKLKAGSAVISSFENWAYLHGGNTMTTGGAWTALQANPSSIQLGMGAINFLIDTGLTVGNTFLPTVLMTLQSDGTLNMLNHKISNLLNPLSAQDAATKAYVDALAGGSGANTSLSNLTAPTAINQSLIPDNANSAVATLGSSSNFWQAIYLSDFIRSASNVIVYNLGNGRFKAPNNTITFNTQDRFMSDSTEILSLSWQARDLRNSAGTPALSWGTAGEVSLLGNKLTNVANPTAAQDAATKAYVDALAGAAGANTSLSNLIAPTAINQDLNLGTNKILGTNKVEIKAVGDYLNYPAPLYVGAVEEAISVGGLLATNQSTGFSFLAGGYGNAGFRWSRDGSKDLVLEDASNSFNPSTWYSTVFGGVNLNIRNGTLKVGGAATINGILDVTANKIINLANPTSAQDAATKAYVDALAGGSGANTSLSNLTVTAINADLLPSADNLRSIGSATLGFTDLFLTNALLSSNTASYWVGTSPGLFFKGTSIIQTADESTGSLTVGTGVKSNPALTVPTGPLELMSGDQYGLSNTGDISVFTGQNYGTGRSGQINITSGTTNAGPSGYITLSTGLAPGFEKGAVLIQNTHLAYSQSVKPAVAPDAGAGTGATATLLNATDLSGKLTINTGMLGVSTGSYATITFNQPYQVPPVVIITPASATLSTSVYVTTTTTSMSINFAVAGGISSTYVLNYMVVQSI